MRVTSLGAAILTPRTSEIIKNSLSVSERGATNYILHRGVNHSKI